MLQLRGSGGRVAGRRVAAYLALLALLVQVLLPVSDAFHHAQLGGAKTGLAAPAASAPADPGDRAPATPPDECDLCKAIHLLGSGILPVLALVLAALVVFCRLEPPRPTLPRGERRLFPVQARAPPFPA